MDQYQRLEFSKAERKIAKEKIKIGILRRHQEWQNEIAALINSPYPDDSNAFDRSMEITKRARDFYKEAMRMEEFFINLAYRSPTAIPGTANSIPAQATGARNRILHPSNTLSIITRVKSLRQMFPTLMHVLTLSKKSLKDTASQAHDAGCRSHHNTDLFPLQFLPQFQALLSRMRVPALEASR